MVLLAAQYLPRAAGSRKQPPVDHDDMTKKPTIADDLAALRAVPGAWKSRPDPLQELCAIRYGEDETLNPEDALAMLMRIHARFMKDPQYWSKRDLMAADTLVCVAASNLRREIVAGCDLTR